MCTLNIVDAIFNGLTDTVFNGFNITTWQFSLNAKAVEGDIGDKFFACFRYGHQAQGNQAEHQQIGSNGVLRKPTDDLFHKSASGRLLLANRFDGHAFDKTVKVASDYPGARWQRSINISEFLAAIADGHRLALNRIVCVNHPDGITREDDLSR